MLGVAAVGVELFFGDHIVSRFWFSMGGGKSGFSLMLFHGGIGAGLLQGLG
jgi:hypothetical protein